MAGEVGNPTDHLMGEGPEEAYALDFFQALRRLQCAHRECPPIGFSRRPADDPVRFGQRPSLAFAPTAIEAIEPAAGGGRPHLYQSFFGLFGPNGPMPLHFTEYARDRLLNGGDPTLVRFLDIFHHRLIQLLFRGWAANRQVVHYETPDHDRFSAYVASFLGIGMESLRGRDAVSDAGKLFYSGRLACATRNAEGLREILREWLGVPAEVEEFVGHWMQIPEDCRCRLGESPSTGALGATALVGARVWVCQHRFRVRLGPMSLARYESLFPGGAPWETLKSWVRNYTGDEFAWDARLALSAAEVPETVLGTAGRLGWSTWVRTRPFEKDANDLVLIASMS
ncbi:MAG: hypothetical protein BWK77_02445 [Verrucomicrobia bacterium A1]|nr:MAG: hypothetical protein BWK77_02445 [Verrucomicrobia bacterium A1]